ncbi:spore germination protein [Virgibacillus halophilus]|uniref:Spore germination protein n=1 Tax=Tigheibacillus halophilus TaxID=361280 RepID=A0ABU5CAJ2_9BACI|nr:spore germination protein [Virgibacillus halophilus]
MGFFNKKQKSQAKQQSKQQELYISDKLDENLSRVKEILGNPTDLVIRKFTVRSTNMQCAIIYIDGLVNDDLIQSNVVKNVQLVTERKQLPEKPKQLLRVIYENIISATIVKTVKTLDELFNGLLYGDTIFLLDGVDFVLDIGTKGWEGRQIEEPVSEGVIRGPREGFVENLQTNIMLVRRNIRDPNLRFDEYQIGRRSKK